MFQCLNDFPLEATITFGFRAILQEFEKQILNLHEVRRSRDLDLSYHMTGLNKFTNLLTKEN